MIQFSYLPLDPRLMGHFKCLSYSILSGSRCGNHDLCVLKSKNDKSLLTGQHDQPIVSINQKLFLQLQINVLNWSFIFRNCLFKSHVSHNVGRFIHSMRLSMLWDFIFHNFDFVSCIWHFVSHLQHCCNCDFVYGNILFLILTIHNELFLLFTLIWKWLTYM